MQLLALPNGQMAMEENGPPALTFQQGPHLADLEAPAWIPAKHFLLRTLTKISSTTPQAPLRPCSDHVLGLIKV